MDRKTQIASILSHYIQVAWNNSGAKWEVENQEEIEELARVIVEDPRIASVGTGACICAASPEWQENAAKRMGYECWLDEWERGKAGVATLDHRCAQHGEHAQPRLWGRHKTLVLEVNAKQWLALGVTYAKE